MTNRHQSGLARPSGFMARVRQQKMLVWMIVPAFLVVLIFNYFPMYGILMGFQDYKVAYGIWGSKWVGLKHFQTFLSNPMASRTIRNTLLLGVYNYLLSFPAPILLALLINELPGVRFKKAVQTISYLPYFLSTVIIVGMLKDFASVPNGLFNQLVAGVFGAKPITFFSSSGWFRTLFIGSGIWQGVGWGTIIYLAALSGVDMNLYEAASIDGAGAWRTFYQILLPTIRPVLTVVALFSFTGAWNDFVWPSIALTNPKNLTLTPGLRMLQVSEGGHLVRQLAGGIMGIIPTFLIYLCAQRYFLSGLNLSAAVKG